MTDTGALSPAEVENWAQYLRDVCIRYGHGGERCEVIIILVAMVIRLLAEIDRLDAERGQR